MKVSRLLATESWIFWLSDIHMECGSGKCRHASELSADCGLYVHVAYCRRKCIYCDFFSAGERIAEWSRYVDALCTEFKHRINEMVCPLRTVYFGGGTPSLMPSKEFRRLCNFLKPYMKEVEEFTLEVNPDDVDSDKLMVWKECGVNRISIGVQTFSDESLAAIGRRHDSQTALRAYSSVREFFSNVSVDLMFGLPYQTIDVWSSDLKKVLDLHPEHISAYSLMYEEGTALTVLRDSERVREVSDETSEKMFGMLIEALSKAGYDHYEISNFALPGCRSVHNSSYWLQKPYIGLGPSAHSYDGSAMRKGNRADLKGYLEFWTPSGDSSTLSHPICEEESLSEEELLEEYVMTRLRLREGIPIKDFKSRFGEKASERLLEKCRFFADRGLVEMNGTNISLTKSAILIADSIILELSDLF